MSRKKKGFIMLICGIIILFGSVAALGFGTDEKGHVSPYLGAICLITGVAGGLLGLAGAVYLTPLPPPKPPKPQKVKPQVVKAKLIAVNGVNQTQRSGTVSGAIMGGLIGGGLGALIGAAANTTDRQYNVDNKYTFLVIYDNQEQKLETVSEKYDKKRFDLLVSKLVVED